MTDDKQKIIERIKKLLALSTSDSIGEAAAAAAKAQELMERHAIEMAMLSDAEGGTDEPSITKDFIWQGGKVPTWLLQLASGICEVNRCRIWYRSLRRATGQSGYIACAGTPESIEKVKMLLDWLQGEVNRLYNEERPDCFDKSAGKRWANAFRLGASSTIVTRLREAMKKARTEMQSGAMNHEDAEVYRKAIESADIETIMRMDAARKRYLPSVVNNAIAKLDNEYQRVNDWMKKNMNMKLGKGAPRNYYGSYEAGYATGRKAGERADLHAPRAKLN